MKAPFEKHRRTDTILSHKHQMPNRSTNLHSVPKVLTKSNQPKMVIKAEAPTPSTNKPKQSAQRANFFPKVESPSSRLPLLTLNLFD